VTDQIKLVREQEGADGTVHFSMKAIQNNWNGVADGLKKAYVGPALVPEAAWLGSQKPGGILGAELDGQTLKIDHADDQAKFSALYELSGETWRLVSTGSDTEVQVPESSNELGVALISRTGLHGDLFRLEEGAR
jgi:hypothetical protein